MKQPNEQANRLRDELAQIERDVTTNREALTQTVSSNQADPKPSEQIAARIMVLEARRQAVQDAIQRSETEAGRREKILSSKEYKQAQQEISELESYFEREAGQIAGELDELYNRLGVVLGKHARFKELVTGYCLDLDVHQRNAKTRSRDFLYLSDVFHMLAIRRNREQIVKSADVRAAEIASHAASRAADFAKREQEQQEAAKRRPFRDPLTA